MKKVIRKSIDIFNKNILQRLLLYWETRGLNEKVERVIIVLAVSMYYDRVIYAEEAEKAEEILLGMIKNKNKAEVVYERVRLKVQEYIKDEELFKEDTQRFIKYIVDDIQLYGIAKDIFEADSANQKEEQELEDLIKRAYDEEYQYKNGESFLD